MVDEPTSTKIYIAPLDCTRCDHEMGAVLFDSQGCIEQFADTATALVCRKCFEDLQQSTLDAKLKWTRLG